MSLSKHFHIPVLIGAFWLGACQMTETPTPAVLSASTDEVMADIKQVLADAMGVANVDIGPGDLTQSSAISVLPPQLGPMEDHSPVVPVQFDLMMQGAKCFLSRRDTGETYPLDGVNCRTAG